MKRRWKIAACIVSVIALGWGWYTVSLNRLATIDFRPLTNFMSSRLGAVVTVPVSDNSKDATSRLTTFLTGSHLASYLIENGVALDGMRSSADLPAVSQDLRLDGWGRPFCVIRTPDRVAIFSGGARGFGSTGCDAARSLEKDIPSLRLDLLNEYPNGTLAVIVGNNET